MRSCHTGGRVTLFQPPQPMPGVHQYNPCCAVACFCEALAHMHRLGSAPGSLDKATCCALLYSCGWQINPGCLQSCFCTKIMLSAAHIRQDSCERTGSFSSVSSGCLRIGIGNTETMTYSCCGQYCNILHHHDIGNGRQCHGRHSSFRRAPQQAGSQGTPADSPRLVNQCLF